MEWLCLVLMKNMRSACCGSIASFQSAISFDTLVNGTDEEFLRGLEAWDEMSRDMTRFYWTDNFHH
ncbi:hypothetical protein HNP29_004359 [Pseudomonas alcaligenes]|nr:hypothetical protein [Pseudomonas alcaligenes]